MTRFYGAIGYSDGNVETAPGVWQEHIVEYNYYGSVLRNARRLETDDKVNSDISVSNSISIVADAYAREHFIDIRYVSWMGTLWKISEVEVVSPRLLLRLGDKYNGPIPA